MKKEIFLPILTLAGGVLGFGLRRWELATAFEPDTGLPIAGMPATYALAALSAVMVLALLFLCRSQFEYLPREDDSAFAAPGNTLYACASILSAFLFLGGGVLMGWSFLEQRSDALAWGTFQIQGFSIFMRLLVAVLAAAAGVALILVAKSRFRGPLRPKYDGLQLLPAYACGVWLVASYQMRAGDPVQQDYIYQIFAIIACLLGLYYCAGFSFGKGKPYLTCLFSLLGVYSSAVTLADGHSLADSLLYAAAMLYLVSTTAVLLHNAEAPIGKRLLQSTQTAQAKQAQETEETTDES